jgi:hypothetical protein
MTTLNTKDVFTPRDFTAAPVGTVGITKIVEHGAVLTVPAGHIAGTTGNVTYELGFCVQLDATHCLLVASMDEQGGGDLCVGNDAFVFERLSDIQADRAIPVNRVDPHYKLKHSPGYAFLAKFPSRMGFIPLGSKLEDGRDHPGAGTGFVLSGCLTKEEKQSTEAPEAPFELIQLRWDGQQLTVLPGVVVTELLGLELNGNAAITNALPMGESLLLPIGIGDGIRMFQFDWNGGEWAATKAGESFITNHGREGLPGEELSFAPGETEPSLRKQGERYLINTRGADGIGRIYESTDGFNYRLLSSRPNHTVPQVLNQGLDGSLYVATNPGPGMVRNPLLAYPVSSDGSAEVSDEPFTLHDEQGIRGDDQPLIPFIDHSVSSNVLLEGRWRHFNFFRVCDLTERTLHAFQINEGMDKAIFGEEGPRKTKLSTSGLYLTELEYE